MNTNGAKATLIFLMFMSQMAQAQWQAGLVAGNETSAGEHKNFIVPWLALETEHWQADLGQINYKWQVKHHYLHTGLAIDITKLNEQAASAVYFQQQASQKLGPIFLKNSLKWQVALNNWRSQHLLAQSFNLANLQLNVSTGLSLTTEAAKFSWQNWHWLNEAQIIFGTRQVHTGAAFSYQHSNQNLQTDTTRLSLFLIRSW